MAKIQGFGGTLPPGIASNGGVKAQQAGTSTTHQGPPGLSSRPPSPGAGGSPRARVRPPPLNLNAHIGTQQAGANHHAHMQATPPGSPTVYTPPGSPAPSTPSTPHGFHAMPSPTTAHMPQTHTYAHGQLTPPPSPTAAHFHGGQPPQHAHADAGFSASPYGQHMPGSPGGMPPVGPAPQTASAMGVETSLHTMQAQSNTSMAMQQQMMDMQMQQQNFNMAMTLVAAIMRAMQERAEALAKSITSGATAVKNAAQ